MTAFKELKDRFSNLTRLRYISALLEWDQQIYMPKDSVKARSEQIALMQELFHKKLISEKTNLLIKEAEKALNLNLIDKALLREIKREYNKAIKVPIELVTEIAKTASLGHPVWEKARKKQDFKIFKPYLNKMVDLKKKYANFINEGQTLYDSLLDIYEPGAESEWISKIFEELKPKLTTILKKIENSSDKPNQDILHKFYNSKKQWNFSLEVLKKLNFNFSIGRQDKSVHPFTTSLSSTDVRITTRISENFFPTCIFGSIHEFGHALYEMGFMKEIHDTFLADGSSLGIHESQSRLWENIIGRSKEFWYYWFPILQNYFPKNLNNHSLDDFFRSINIVQPSLIRVEADEVTYGLHIILRFEIEKELIDNDLLVSESPELWNNNMEELFGITPSNDSEGILQDVHWSGGAFGYFPTYILGNLYASQFYADCLKKNPYMNDEIKKGNYTNLINYLKNEIHQYGRVFTPLELLNKVTKEDLNTKYFIDYLENKFYSIYKIH